MERLLTFVLIFFTHYLGGGHGIAQGVRGQLLAVGSLPLGETQDQTHVVRLGVTGTSAH